MDYSFLVATLVGIVLAATLIIGIIALAVWGLNRPKFHKGDWVYYHTFASSVVEQGQIMSHDQSIARKWAIKRMDDSLVWVYEGDIGKQ